MREDGMVASARGLLPFGHLCWAFTRRAEFLTRAAEYALDGIRSGQRVCYIADAPREELREELGELDPAIARALASDAARVQPLREFAHESPATGHIDPPTTVEDVALVTEQAVADGYTGVRAVVDCTALARTSGQRDRFAVLEYLLDRQMAASPISALCGYDAADLGAAGVAEIACLHPFIQAGRSPFRLYADDGVSFALAGDLDLAGEGLFTTTLRQVLPMATESSLIIDGRRLEFIGHRALLALDRQAVANDRAVLLRNVAPVVARVAQLLPLRKLHVEPIAA